MGHPILTAEPDRVRWSGPLERQGDRVLIGGYEPGRLITERAGLSQVETPGGGQERATWAEVTVVFSRKF
jgi:hypothetical protein